MTDMPAGHPDTIETREDLGPCECGCGRHAPCIWRSTHSELRFANTCTWRHELALTEQGYRLVRSVPLPA